MQLNFLKRLEADGKEIKLNDTLLNSINFDGKDIDDLDLGDLTEEYKKKNKKPRVRDIVDVYKLKE